MPLKKPSELFEQRRKESLAEELAQKKNLEDKQLKNKKIASPKELFGEVIEVKEPSIVEEIVEEPVDPYLEEIGALKSDLQKIYYAIPEETDLTEVYQDIENLKDRIDNLPKQKSYDEDIQSIREELERIEDSIPVPEVFDPSDLYENISALKNKLEEVRSEIPTIPEPILYDYQLDQLKEMVVDVRNSIPVVPEIRYYEKELNEIINAIEEVRSEIPVVPEIKYYDNEISAIENRLIEIQNSIPVIPEIKYYDDEIASVKNSIPEVKYYDKDVKKLKEEIASVKGSIPEIKYYDEDVKELKEEIASVKNSIPEVKYYDEEVKDLYKKVSAIKIPDQGKYLREIKEIYSTFEEKNHKLLEKVKYLEEVFEKFNEETLTEGLLNEPPEVKNSDPLTPLDQNFVTLDQLKDHYRLFINRIQQQLSTIGGGGEYRFRYLDDVVGIKTNSNYYNGKYLQWNSATNKAEFVTVTVGGTQTLNQTLGYGNTSSLGMSVGVITATYFVGDGSLLTNVPGSANSGYANTAGIATYATKAGIATYASTAGIATAAQGLSGTPNIIVGIATATKYYGDGSGLTGIVATGSGVVVQNAGVNVGTAATLNFNNNISVSLSGGVATINAVGGISSTASINTTGIITANSYYVGSTQVINSAGQWVGSGLSVYSNIDGGVPNSVYGGIPVIDGGGP